MSVSSTGFPVANAPTTRRAAADLFRTHRWRLARATVLYLLAAGSGLVGPWAVGRIIDAIAGGTTSATITRYGMVMVVALVLQAVFSTLASRTAMRTGERVFAQLRERFMEVVVRLPLSPVERAGTGDLVTRTTRDVYQLSEAVRFGIPELLLSVLTLIATVVISLLVDPLVSLAMIVMTLIVPVTRWYLRRSRPVWERVGAGFSQVSEAIGANAESGRDIDLLSLGEIRRAAVDNAIGELYWARRREVSLSTVLLPSINLAFSLPVVAVLAWGGWLAIEGISTAGAVATVALYVTQLAQPVERLIRWLDRIQQSAVSFARILGVEVLVDDDPATDADDADHQGVIAPGDAPLVLTDIAFGYLPGHEVLHDISLTIQPGERLAIVGPSGSGKSTLARIMSGIEVPTAGAVRIGTTDLSGRPVRELRQIVALVTQEIHVFVGTLAENLALARPDATPEQLRAALRTVGATWVDRFGDGLQTWVGSGGVQLTPAQAQQVALARLLLLDPQVVILDEATAMFDPSRARTYERAFSNALAGRTVIAIAHRLQTAVDADRVALLVDGRLLEVGTHEELLGEDGRYAALWRAWTGPGASRRAVQGEEYDGPRGRL